MTVALSLCRNLLKRQAVGHRRAPARPGPSNRGRNPWLAAGSISLFFALFIAGAAQAQVWPARPDDPVVQAERLRLERERWRAAQDAREADARADQRRTDAVVSELRNRRGPVLPPPPGPEADLAPLPDLQSLEQEAAAAARARALNTDDRLDGLRTWLDQTRHP